MRNHTVRAGERPAARTGQAFIDWIRTEGEARRLNENPDRPAKLEPVENFPNGESWFETIDPKGRRREAGEESRVLRAIIAQTCNGWRMKPTALEGEAAIKSRDPDGLGPAMIRTLICEADVYELIKGEREGAWSLQDLAWWIDTLGIRCNGVIHWLNAMSRGYMGRTS